MIRKKVFNKGFLIAALSLFGFFLSLTSHPLTIGHSSLAYTQDVTNSHICYLPHLNLGQDWQTTISITNPECKCNQRRAKVTLTAYDKDGASLGVFAGIKRIRAGKTKTIDTQTLPPGTESLKIESNGNLICNAIFKTTDGTKSEVVPTIKEPSRQLDFPALVSDDDLYIYKTITLLNPKHNPAIVDIIALDKDGYEIDRNVLPPLSSMESKTFSLLDIFDPRTLKDLSTVRAISDSNIMGLQLVDYPDSDLVGLPALIITSKTWTFPIITKGGNLELWTTVGIINPGENTASITIEAFDAGNNSLGIVDSRSIFPGATLLFSTANIINGDIPLNAASLKVSSNQPVSGYEVIGVVNGNGLTAVIGIPEEDHTTVGFEIKGTNDGGVLNAYSMVKMGDGSIKSIAENLGSGGERITSIVSKIMQAPAKGDVRKSVGVVLNTSTTTDTIVSIRLWFPINSYNPYNVPIYAVLDHNRATGIIVSYAGERGLSNWSISSSKNKNLRGYGGYRDNSTPPPIFYVAGNYYNGKPDNRYLWYELQNRSGKITYQHSGYDYGVLGTITASASGKLYIVKFDKINGPSNPEATDSGTNSAWYRFHTFKIVHQEDEQGKDVLATWYLHAEKFVNDLDKEVRNKMGGDAVYDCKQKLVADTDTDGDGFNDALFINTVDAREELAIIGGWGYGTNTMFGKHLHFEVRLNNSLIDPYGWEGDNEDPLANNSEEILWEGYTKPTIISAVLDANSNTLTVTGNNFVQSAGNPILQIWNRYENDTASTNKNDGTYRKDVTTTSISNTQVVANVDQDILDNFDSYVVKIRIPDGPRSKAAQITTGCTIAVSSDRWKGEYYNNKDLSGSPSIVRDDGNGFINFDWGSGSPNSSCGISEDNFSVRWTRTVFFDAGTYRFTVTSDDGFRLYVDGTSKLEKWFDQGATTYTVDVPLTTGNHIIKMEYYENRGNAVAKLSWQTVSVTPFVTYFKINNDASSTTTRTVTLNNTATGSPTHYMASESSNFSGASWQTYSMAPNFTLSSGNGTKTVYFKVKNSAGESAVVNDSIILNEAIIPVVTYFKINNDASSTTSRVVTLNNTATGSPTHYMASESPTFNGASWQTYSTAPSFTLSSGNGTKTVYFKGKNSTGESTVVSDSIMLNETIIPVVTYFKINNDAASTTSRVVMLNNTATGNPTHYMASESSNFSGASWQTYSTTPNFTLSSGNGTKTVYFKVKNSAGESAIVNDTITLTETTPLPDLTSSATVASSYTSGQTGIQIPVTVYRSGDNLNQGTYVHAKLYWSTNSTWDTGDSVLWSSNDSIPDFPNSVLNSNGSKTVTATIDIPSVSEGTYYIISYADAPTSSYLNGYYIESNENNNTSAYKVSISGNRPPVARLTMSAQGKTAYENEILNLTVEQGQTVSVSFSAARSYDPNIDDYIAAYKWYINGIVVSTSRDFSSSLEAGTHQIYLEVWDNHGAQGAVGASIIITTSSITVSYQGHFAYTGWGSWVSNGATCGTAGGNQMEAIKIITSNYGIQYRAHVAYDGWLPWVSNGAIAGTTGEGKSLQAIEIILLNAPSDLHVSYRVYVRGKVGFQMDQQQALQDKAWLWRQSRSSCRTGKNGKLWTGLSGSLAWWDDCLGRLNGNLGYLLIQGVKDER